MHKIVVIGGGFAGLWSAVGAARKFDEQHIPPSEFEITLVNRDAYHCIRVRNYEADLSAVRVPLRDVLEPAGVRLVEGEVEKIDVAAQVVTVAAGGEKQSLPYDRLVLAAGSQLVRPAIAGLAEFAFDVDTYRGATRLHEHLRSLASADSSPGQGTVVIVGAGLTGVETACEMPGKLRAAFAQSASAPPLRVVLMDHQPHVGSDMGEAARPVIETALQSLGVETRVGVRVVALDESGLTLDSDEKIPAATIVWCVGLRASPLTEQIPVERDRWGRLPVDEFLRVKNVKNVFAAGDVAAMLIDGVHPSIMSCQHGRPMGRYAGHNVAADLLGLPLLGLNIDWYVTVLDLGPWGAVYTEGWDRHVVAQGAVAKRTKQTINCERIYPPLNRDRAAILAAAEPIVQTPPHYGEA